MSGMNKVYISRHQIQTGVLFALAIVVLYYAFMHFSEKKASYDNAPKPPVQIMVTNDGRLVPQVSVQAPNPNLPTLIQAMNQDSTDDLGRFVRGYIYYANNLVVNQPIVTARPVVEFVVDWQLGTSMEIPWNNRYATGIQYRGGAMVDSRRMNEMAFGALLKWTKTNDYVQAVETFFGEPQKDPMAAFRHAITIIHQQILSSIYLPDFNHSSLYDLAKIAETEDKSDPAAFNAKLESYFQQNIERLLSYLSGVYKNDPFEGNKQAYIVASYYLAPQILKLHENKLPIIEATEAEGVDHLKALQERRAAEEKARMEREKAEQERRNRYNIR